MDFEKNTLGLGWIKSSTFYFIKKKEQYKKTQIIFMRCVAHWKFQEFSSSKFGEFKGNHFFFYIKDAFWTLNRINWVTKLYYKHKETYEKLDL